MHTVESAALAATAVARAAAAGEADHAVLFYETEPFLLQTVARFVGAALGSGDAGVVIATASHLEALEEEFRAAGLDLATMRAQHRYLALDAVETLAELMVDGHPDPARFDAVVGGALARVTAAERRTRAFGEMVSILATQGRVDAAIALEDLWNELAHRVSFTLLCGYPIAVFGGRADDVAFREVCAEHDQVLPTERFPGTATAPAGLRLVAELQQRAAALDAEATERRALEKTLHREQEQFADFFENDAIGFHWVGADGRILRANRAEVAMLGYAHEEYVGHPIAEFHVDRERIASLLDRVARGESVHDYEVQLRCKDGTVKHALIDTHALFENGTFIHSRCSTRDITDRKRAEAERERLLAAERAARAQAEAASMAKDELLSIVSHELRTPLAAILGWVAVLRAGADGAQAARAFETIERNGRQQAKVIEDLVDVSRMATGRLRLDLAPIDLAEVVRDAVETIRPAVEAKGLALDVELDPRAGTVRGDAGRLHQVTWNLLSNAVKFTPPGGSIQVRSRRGAHDVELVVRDSGCGIAPELLPFVFERFRQADSSASRRHGGLGLGLAIVRHLVELHGGQVVAASEGKDAGAAFTLSLPAKPERLAAGR